MCLAARYRDLSSTSSGRRRRRAGCSVVARRPSTNSRGSPAFLGGEPSRSLLLSVTLQYFSLAGDTIASLDIFLRTTRLRMLRTSVRLAVLPLSTHAPLLAPKWLSFRGVSVRPGTHHDI